MSEEDLNPETREISPDRGNHPIRLTGAGDRTQVFRGVFAVWSATWPCMAGRRCGVFCSRTATAAVSGGSALKVYGGWAAPRVRLPSVMNGATRTLR